jgi:hypothetical protein
VAAKNAMAAGNWIGPIHCIDSPWGCVYFITYFLSWYSIPKASCSLHLLCSPSAPATCSLWKVSVPEVDTSNICSRGLTNFQEDFHEHISKSKWGTWELVLPFLEWKWISYETLTWFS